MKVKYTYDKKKSLEPIHKSKWFYLEILIFTLLALYFVKEFEFLIGVFLFLSIPFLLQITLHVNYYFNDKDVILEIDYSEKKIIHYKNNIKAEINFDEIESIVRCQGSRYQETFGKHVIPSNFYNHTVIVGKNKKKIRFSDFILKDFGLFPIEKKVIIFPFLNLI
ncbi:hypothetical protein [Flavobacterium sp. UBA7682]|nr:hypothetical protein [Flavobacterium sp. UBA7682]